MELRRPVNFEAFDYYNNQRLISIQKSRKPLQQRLQRIANEIIDDFVFNYHSNVSDSIINKSKPEYYRNKILNLNVADTKLAFSRLLQKSSLRNDTVNKIAANMHVNKVATMLTNAEVERIQKNILWADHIISNSEFQVDTYQRLVEKMRPTSSRKLMLEKSIQEGISPRGREYTYKELKNVSRDLEKYKTNSLDLEKLNMENGQAIRDGGDMIHTSKTWVWSSLENTRHSQMDNQTVNINGKFEVFNEVTGDLDFLLFPGDIDNDDNNCSNICGCKCSILYG